jgi:FMN reductase
MLVVGVGGTLHEQSTSGCALRVALAAVAKRGIATRCFSGEALRLPLYDPRCSERTEAARALVASLREADGVILCSPGYHGGVSGLVKNALDYTEDMAHDARVYFDGLPVGHIAVAMGWQAAVATAEALRSITHALRGWPTPYACTVRSRAQLFDAQGRCTDPVVEEQLATVGAQVADFVLARHRASLRHAAGEPSMLSV